MKQPDDFKQPEAPLRDDGTAKAFPDLTGDPSRRQAVERSFETQSGYLVLIKQLGSRYALSFKRQIGTPPSSSIFLTADEAKRLSNMFGSDSRQQNEYPTSTENFKEKIDSLRSLRNRRRKSAFVMPTTLFIISLALWAVLAKLAFQFLYPAIH